MQGGQDAPPHPIHGPNGAEIHAVAAPAAAPAQEAPGKRKRQSRAKKKEWGASTMVGQIGGNRKKKGGRRPGLEALKEQGAGRRPAGGARRRVARVPLQPPVRSEDASVDA
jgi:hypothetical protein